MGRYVFIIHSSITFSMAAAIIAHHGWAEKDCIFLTDRAFDPQISSVSVLDISPYSISSLSWKRKAEFFSTVQKNLRHHRALRQLLNKHIATTFDLFIPHTWSYTHWALINHPLCRKYALVEEGTLSYLRDLKAYLPSVSRPKSLILAALVRWTLGSDFPTFPQPLEYHHPKYGGCYGISEHTFPTLPENGKVILLPAFSGNETWKDIKRLLITGPWVERDFISLEEYRQLKTALFESLVASGVDSLHVKFHPDQYFHQHSIQVFRAVAQLFAHQINVIELPHTVSPEEIALAARPDFYMAISSVAVYAQLFGCRVFSYAGPMIEQWPHFSRFFNQMPDFVIRDLLPVNLDLASKLNKAHV